MPEIQFDPDYVEFDGRLTSTEYWRSNWSGIELPYVIDPLPDMLRILRNLMPRRGMRLLEVGCAPGGWMAFFRKEFDYRVFGVEYVSEAADLARKNLEMLSVEGHVICGDFFKMDEDSPRYDAVFSGGFIEHFRDTDDVVARIAAVAREQVVTLVPNLHGINGAICKAMRRDVYDKHVLIDPTMLRDAHEKAGLITQFCGYVGGVKVARIADRKGPSGGHRYLAQTIDRPVECLNQVFKRVGERTGLSMSARWWSPSVLYVGRVGASERS